MVKRLAAQTGRVDENTQVLDYFILTVERLECARSQGALEIALGSPGRGILSDIEIVGGRRHILYIILII